MCSEKHVYQWAKHGFCHDEPGSKRQFIEWKHTESPVKKKFWAQQSVKKVILDSLLEHKKDPSLLISFKKTVHGVETH